MLMTQTDLEQVVEQTQTAIRSATTADQLDDIDVALFHKKTGRLAKLLHGLADISDATERKRQGAHVNAAKHTLLQAILEQRAKLGVNSGTKTARLIDPTLPAAEPHLGSLHPIRLVQNELVDIFRSMSFAVYEGNELETEDYCFEYLNIPPTHPARDLQDTFYLESRRSDGLKEVMRTHTSNMQVRLMQQFQPPLRIVVPGRVFRNEAVDASHEHTFYQMEGFVVDKNVSVGNLTYVLKLAMSKLLKSDVKVRLRPGYFPYVEPGFEADCSCTACNGKGCSVCKQTGWVEMLGCGMTHPKVYEAAGYEAGKYTGFAFGIGLNRLAMLKFGIRDIRYFMSGDLRVMRQF